MAINKTRFLGSQKRMIVTGAAGFIGSHLVDRLLSSGYAVLGIDNLSTGSMDNLTSALCNSNFILHNVDIRNDLVIEIVSEYKPSTIFHLAAQLDVRASIKDPLYDLDVNLVGGLNVLEAARLANVEKIVFASSCAVYQEPAACLPITENEPMIPISPYGVSKKAFIDYLGAYNHIHSLNYATLIFANAYGPRQGRGVGGGIISNLAKSFKLKESFSIYGDSSITRDFIYVDDIVDALVAASRVGFGVYNIGTSIETSINELCSLMSIEAGNKIELNYYPSRPGEIKRSCLNFSKAQNELGWVPKTNLKTGVKLVFDYINQNSDSINV